MIQVRTLRLSVPQGTGLARAAALLLAAALTLPAHAADELVPVPPMPRSIASAETADPVPRPPEAKTAKPSSAVTSPPRWTYDGERGPERWGALDPAYAACRDGERQSPIDIDRADPARLAPLEFHYRVTMLDMAQDGHTVRVNYRPGSYVTIGEDRFDLVQFHFHTPGEHRIGGKRFPMEMHLVHRNARGELAVVAVLAAAGEPNLAAREIWAHLPEATDTHVLNARVLINVRDLLPDERQHFRYAGSLTTPPCTEGVHWLVLLSPVTFSTEQIEMLSRIVGPNARPVQARRGRFVMQAIGG